MGSPIFADHIPDYDSAIVRRLKQTGVIIIGKTNTPEFGAGSHTFNPVFGATHNPYDLDRGAGGSSGGAAAAVASGMLPFADGSDMGGSLRNPASFCNVVGVRPSPGLVSNPDALDLWDSLAVHGPIARSVADAALLLRAMSESDRWAPFSVPVMADLEPVTGREGTVRVAWSPILGGLPVDPAVTNVLEARRADMEALGWQVEDVEPDFSDADEAFKVLRALFFLSALGELYRTQAHLMKATLVWNLRQGESLTPERIANALKLRTNTFRSTAELLSNYDLLAAPAAQVAPFPIELEWPHEIAARRMAHYLEWMRVCSRVTVSAHPALSLPAGFTETGLPVGLQLVGGYRAEKRLLKLAAELEEATAYGLVRPLLSPGEGPV